MASSTGQPPGPTPEDGNDRGPPSADGDRDGPDVVLDDPEIWDRRVTVRERKLRSEAVDDRRRPRSVSDTNEALRDYLRDKNSMSIQFSNGDVEPTSHRFSDGYAKEKYGKVLGADREIIADADDLHCAIVTRRGYPWNADDDGRAPVDFLDDLLESNSNAMAAYRRHLGEHARVTTIKHHEHGYPHIHDHIWHFGEVDRDDLKPALAAHVRNSPVARPEGHPVDGAIRVWEADPRPPDGNPSRTPRTSLVHHCTKHLCWGGGLNQEPSKQRLMSALWVTGRYSTRFGSTFGEYVERSQDSAHADDRGEFVGVELADGSTIDAEDMADGGGGTTMVKARPWVDPEDADPIPDRLCD